MNMIRFAQYIRVSSTPQLARYGPAEQDAANRKYVERLGGELVATYTDAVSGTTSSRSGLDQMLADATAGLFEAVVFYNVGRVGRKALVTLDIIERCYHAGLQVHGTSKGIYDLSNPSDELMLGIEAQFAQFDYRWLRKRMLEGKHQAARVGQISWNWQPYGRRVEYTADGKRQLVLELAEAATVRAMYEWCAGGMGTLRIYKRLVAEGHPPPKRSGRWGLASIRKILTNYSYAGTLEVAFKGGSTHTLTVEPIVDVELWQRAQESLKRMARGRSQQRYDWPLLGLVVCGLCGWRLHLTKYTPGKNYLRCQNVRCRAVGAGNHHYTKLYNVALNLFAQALHDPSIIEVPNPPAAPPPQLASLDARAKRLLDLYELGRLDIEEYTQRMAAIDVEREAATRVSTSFDFAEWHKTLAKQANTPTLDAMRAVGVRLVVWPDKRVVLRLV